MASFAQELHLDGLLTLNEDKPRRADAQLTAVVSAADAAFQSLTRLTRLCVVDSDASWVAAVPSLSTLRVRCKDTEVEGT